MTITPTLTVFNERFPDMAKYNLTQADLDGVQWRVVNWISNEEGQINLSTELQTNGVYLATAHVLFLMKNPDFADGRLTNASEGGVSAGFQTAPVQTIRDWSLSRTDYGIELIQILQQIQPPIPEKYDDPVPYYGTGGLNVSSRMLH